MDEVAITAGAQSLRRALQVMRLIGEHQQSGLSATEVMRLAGLERSTAHRLLSCLLEEHFVEKDAETKRYRLGGQAMQIGFASMRRLPLVDTFRPVMQRLARMSGDTVFLVTRHGDDSLCLHREEGSFPVKVFTVNVGQKRLLGIGAAGMALLAAMDDPEIDAVISRQLRKYQAAGLERAALWRGVRAARKDGYSRVVDPLTIGVCGVGSLVATPAQGHAAISFGALTGRMGPARSAELGQLLIETLRKMA